MSTDHDDGHFTPHPGPYRSLAERIAEAEDVETILHDVPQWGVKIELRSPTGQERADMVSRFIDYETGENKARNMAVLYPAVVAACAYDPETGERVFDSHDAAAAVLNGKNGSVVEDVAKACMPLVGLKAEDVEAEKDGSSSSQPSESDSI
jgi:hypothetical protein